MITRRGLVTWISLSLLALGLDVSPAAGARSNEPLAVVVSSGSSMNTISLYELKRLYLGDAMNAPNGQKIIALNRGTRTAERVGFDQTVLGMNPEQAARYWIDRRIRGRSGAPKAVDPADIVQKVVSRLPGAISYVRLHQVKADMKVVKIDGKRPGDAGYPIYVANGSGPPARSASLQGSLAERLIF